MEDQTSPNTLVYCQHDSGPDVLQDTLVSISAHPTSDILAVGDIGGKITMYSYGVGQECLVVKSVSPSQGYSCRVLQFNNNGEKLFSGSSERGHVYCTDAATGSLLHSLSAHRAPLYSILPISDKLLATGDEVGEIKLWDLRSLKQVACLKENTDFISEMVVDDDVRTLLSTSGDGTLTTLDMRQRTLHQRSDTNESELLSLAIVKNGKKVVCGDGEGALMIYNWGLWNDITDRYPIHNNSVDTIQVLHDSVICTGCMDGWIRSVQILPNQFLGSVGQHSNGLPVESMCLSHDREYLITSSQDSCYFWPVDSIPTLPANEEEEEGEGGYSRRKKKRKRKNKNRDLEKEEIKKSKKSELKDFFSDINT